MFSLPTKIAVVEQPNLGYLITPKVSIIVLTFNHKLYIRECLESLLHQKTNFEFEILLGDDDSTDGTRAICVEYANKFPNIIRLLFHSRENNIKVDGRPTGRFNYLYNLSISRGVYIALCEGDDYWADEQKLQKQVNFLENNQDYSFCWTRFKTYNQKTKEFTEDFNGKYFEYKDTEYIDFDFERSLNGWHIGNLTLLYRRSCFEISVHDRFKYFKDVHLIAQLLKKGKGACLNFFGAVYRIHDSGVHSSVSVYDGFAIGYKTHKEIYLDNRSNIFLKKKYLLSFKNFVNANIQEGYLFMAFWMSFKLFFLNWSLIDLLKHNKRIFTKLLKD